MYPHFFAMSWQGCIAREELRPHSTYRALLVDNVVRRAVCKAVDGLWIFVGISLCTGRAQATGSSCMQL